MPISTDANLEDASVRMDFDFYFILFLSIQADGLLSAV